MAPKLDETPLRSTEHCVIANLSGKLSQPYGVENLIKQIDSPVLWTDTLSTAVDEGCDTFFEIGPGRVLFGLAKKAVPKGLKVVHSNSIARAIKEARSLAPNNTEAKKELLVSVGQSPWRAKTFA